MFHTIITTAYVIPNIYVFLRLWQLFINKGYRIHYTLIYLFLALIYPISNLFNEKDTGILSAIFNWLGDYILPFYLYLFLSVLVFDLFLIINYIFKIVPSEKFKDSRFKICCLSAILFVSAGVVIAGVINFNKIRISEYSIEIPRKTSKINHLKIAFVADFHLKERTSVKFVERFAQEIAKIKPDLVVFGGDIVEGDRKDENMTHFEKLFSEIRTTYGVYGVLGNHEYYGGQDKGSFFDKAGIKILCDSIMAIDSSFNLGGRYDSHYSRRKSIDELMRSERELLPMILIDHRPTDIDHVSKTTVDIQLSGHTHNGQMFPINLITRKVYTLSWGYRKIGNTHFFVTSGIRLWGPPVRTTAKSEIMVINVSFTGQ
jgi:uncharacterized protein